MQRGLIWLVLARLFRWHSSQQTFESAICQPEHVITGSLGFRGNFELVSERRHLEHTDSRSDAINVAFRHVAHKRALDFGLGDLNPPTRLSGRTSAKIKPSRSTIVPSRMAIGLEKTGESYTKVWNSPFSPQASTGFIGRVKPSRTSTKKSLPQFTWHH